MLTEKTCMNCGTSGCDHKDARVCSNGRKLWMPIEDEVRAEAQGPVVLPDLPAGIVLHSQLGELYDRLQVQQYAMKYAGLAAPQPPGTRGETHVSIPRADYKKLQAKVAILDGLSQDAIDGGWTFRGMEAYAKGLEAKVAKQAALIEKCEKQMKEVHKYVRVEFERMLDVALDAIAAHRGQ